MELEINYGVPSTGHLSVRTSCLTGLMSLMVPCEVLKTSTFVVLITYCLTTLATNAELWFCFQ